MRLVGGVWVTHVMFDEPVFMVATIARRGTGLDAAEAVTTFGLVLVFPEFMS